MTNIAPAIVEILRGAADHTENINDMSTTELEPAPGRVNKDCDCLSIESEAAIGYTLYAIIDYLDKERYSIGHRACIANLMSTFADTYAVELDIAVVKAAGYTILDPNGNKL